MLDIGIVQQSAWDIPLDSMPLAAGYLKSVVDADECVDGEADVTIHNFRGGLSLNAMARQLLSGRLPDVLAFSVLGWNYRSFACLAQTYKQLRPDGLVVFGGNHVAHQAERLSREAPWVDVVVNGEGELTFRDLVREVVRDRAHPDLTGVAGISFTMDGALRTNADRPRIEDLDTIASPFLSGAIPLTDDRGAFPYEFALMETSRGCPYKCAFCYWGGAIGQRVRTFSRERLAAELDLMGRHRVHTVFLCDANFGMLQSDEEFVEDLIRTRERYGYPVALEANWAKNKSERFHRIVRELKRHDLKSSFLLALQTLTDEALADMNRRNMRINQWQELVDWLGDEGLECYAEMIWGAPGETPSSFLEGYDRLAVRVPRIAVYPLLILPNTAYAQERERHGFVTVRGQSDDFEYVLASRSSSMAEHLQMQRFMFLARIAGENQFFKYLWVPARLLGDLSQSRVIGDLLDWMDRSEDPDVVAFRDSFPVLAESPHVARGHRTLHLNARLDGQIERWWRERIVPRFPAPWRAFGNQLYAFARGLRPVYQEPGAPPPDGWRLEGDEYVSDPVEFDLALDDALAALGRGDLEPPPARPVTYRFRAPAGFYHHLDNHETGAHYFGRPEVFKELAVSP